MTAHCEGIVNCVLQIRCLLLERFDLEGAVAVEWVLDETLIWRWFAKLRFPLAALECCSGDSP